MMESLWRTVLKSACVASGAQWAARLFYDGQAWHVESVWGVRMPFLRRHLQNLSWLNGALSSGRVRSRRQGAARWYAFPEPQSQTVYLVAVPETLAAAGRQIWRLVTQVQASAQSDPTLAAALFAEGDALAMVSAHEMKQTLRHVLALYLMVASAEGGWLGVLTGNELQIQAASVPALAGEQALVDLGLWQERQPDALSLAEAQAREIPFLPAIEHPAALLFVPLYHSRRPLAAVLLWRKEPFTARERLALADLMPYAAQIVETQVALDEISGLARRLGVLNDFIRSVSVASTLDKSLEQVFALLQRTFGTKMISLALFSPDETQLRFYQLRNDSIQVHIKDAAHSPLAETIRHGRLMRYARLAEATEAPRLHQNARSLLWSPLRHYGRPIGAIILEHEEPQAFSSADENLLAGIASHLSGAVEYGRLLEHAEAHAHNLEALHLLVRHLIGQTDLHAVVQGTADILTEIFGYELVLVGLRDQAGRMQLALGGTEDAALIRDDKLAAMLKTSDWQDQSSLLSSEADSLVDKLGWVPRTLLSVPVLLDDEIVGLVHLESSQSDAFSSGDRLTLEALAGVLGNVTVLAWQYRQLTDTIRRLEEARQELQARVQAQQLAETRLLQAAKLAAVGEMAAGVAHELNNPLTTVIGFTELVLADDHLSASLRQDLKLVLKEAKRARDVVRRLLDFSRQSERAFLRADLNAVIEDVLALMAHLMHSRGVHLRKELQPDLPWVVIDSNRMKQVFLNLLHNALNAMPNGGEITVTTTVDERSMAQWVRVDVQDTGVGIPPELLDRIFEPFFTTRAEQGGTGLGLSVTYGIVSDHKGTIEVFSEPGQGARFSIWLPLPEDETF